MKNARNLKRLVTIIASLLMFPTAALAHPGHEAAYTSEGLVHQLAQHSFLGYGLFLVLAIAAAIAYKRSLKDRD